MNWTQFLEVVVPDEEARKELQRFVGKLVQGERPNKGLALYGDFMAGKAIIIEVLKRLVSKRGVCVEVYLHEIARDSQRYFIKHAPLVTIHNVSGRAKCAEIIVELLGGDPITIRKPHGKTPEYLLPRFGVVLVCNGLPEWLRAPQVFARFSFVECASVVAWGKLDHVPSPSDFGSVEVCMWAKGE